MNALAAIEQIAKEQNQTIDQIIERLVEEVHHYMTEATKSLRPSPKLVGQKFILRIDSEDEVEGTVTHFERESRHGYVALIAITLADGSKRSAIWDVFKKSVIRAA